MPENARVGQPAVQRHGDIFFGIHAILLTLITFTRGKIKDHLKKKRQLVKKKVLLNQDNVCKNVHFPVHPTYSLDLAPSDRFSFPSLKKAPTMKLLLKQGSYCGDLEKSFHLKGVKKL